MVIEIALGVALGIVFWHLCVRYWRQIRGLGILALIASISLIILLAIAAGLYGLFGSTGLVVAGFIALAVCVGSMFYRVIDRDFKRIADEQERRRG